MSKEFWSQLGSLLAGVVDAALTCRKKPKHWCIRRSKAREDESHTPMTRPFPEFTTTWFHSRRDSSVYLFRFPRYIEQIIRARTFSKDSLQKMVVMQLRFWFYPEPTRIYPIPITTVPVQRCTEVEEIVVFYEYGSMKSHTLMFSEIVHLDVFYIATDKLHLAPVPLTTYLAFPPSSKHDVHSMLSLPN